ncbi:hypothetical protein BN2497_1811 [Janthinobacterium sp. CG23_2]|nr:hypothetical protein BN2497_1811 [Janthinobacterium sp. CG23_2]CUU27303.1 hypothetical protein BN3177_1811 [Janthinobacterium sp. CG23_2]
MVTMDTPPWYFRLVYRAPAIHQMKKSTPGFYGVSPVDTHVLVFPESAY